MVCFPKKLEGLVMENVVISGDPLEYFTAVRYNLWPFGLVCGNLVYFLHFGMLGPRKVWQPWAAAEEERINFELNV
jgi:hypothetical protein